MKILLKINGASTIGNIVEEAIKKHIQEQSEET